MLFTMSAEGTLKQIESPFKISRNNKVRGTHGPVDDVLSKKKTRFLKFLLLGKQTMKKPAMKFVGNRNHR